MINVHSHPRVLETLKRHQAITWSDPDLGVYSTLIMGIGGLAIEKIALSSIWGL